MSIVSRNKRRIHKSEGNNIKNDPVAKNILKNIEIVRKEFASIIEKVKDEHEE